MKETVKTTILMVFVMIIAIGSGFFLGIAQTTQQTITECNEFHLTRCPLPIGYNINTDYQLITQLNLTEQK